MKFIISPRWHSRDEGDYIQFSDTMYFQNVKTKYYLTVYRNESITKSPVAKNPSMQNINVDTAISSLAMVTRLSNQAMVNSCKIKDENPYVPEKNIIDLDCMLNQVYLSQEKESSWTVFIHQIQPELRYNTDLLEIEGYNDKNTVYGSDIIQISHSEINALMTADVIYPEPHKVTKKVYTKKKQNDDETPEKRTKELKTVTILEPEHKSQQVYFKTYEKDSAFSEDCYEIYSMWEIIQKYAKYPGDPVRIDKNT